MGIFTREEKKWKLKMKRVWISLMGIYVFNAFLIIILKGAKEIQAESVIIILVMLFVINVAIKDKNRAILKRIFWVIGVYLAYVGVGVLMEIPRGIIYGFMRAYLSYSETPTMLLSIYLASFFPIMLAMRRSSYFVEININSQNIKIEEKKENISIKEDTKKCPSCGTTGENKEANFCGFCGIKITDK